MTKVAIIGATGSLGTALRRELAGDSNYNVTLFSRRAGSLKTSANEKAISGSTEDKEILDEVIKDQDILFVALSGNLPKMAEEIVSSMKRVGSKRIVFVSSMGIYGEVAGEEENIPLVLLPYRKAADIVEMSELAYTILRPGWFDNSSDISCQITKKGETFYGHDISRKAIATLVKEIIDNPKLYVNESLGIYR